MTSAVDVIRAKRDRQRLTDEQIDWVVAAYTRGDVAEEQMSALAMAILLNGMDRTEISRWTDAMIASGVRMSFPAEALGGRTARAHEAPGGGRLSNPAEPSGRRPTPARRRWGGVGYKTSLRLSPLVAACGAAVPQ